MRSIITDLKQFSKIVKSFERGEICFFCIGNPIMSDDGIGLYISENLNDLKDINLINAENVPENYVSKILKLKPKVLIVIDAMDFSSNPGDIKIFKESEIINYSSSTHSISIKMIIDYVKEELNFDFYLVGIQPKNIGLGSNISERVIESADKLISLIRSFYT